MAVLPPIPHLHNGALQLLNAAVALVLALIGGLVFSFLGSSSVSYLVTQIWSAGSHDMGFNQSTKAPKPTRNLDS